MESFVFFMFIGLFLLFKKKNVVDNMFDEMSMNKFIEQYVDNKNVEPKVVNWE